MTGFHLSENRSPAGAKFAWIFQNHLRDFVYLYEMYVTSGTKCKKGFSTL